MKQKYKGIIFIIVSAFCFALMNLLIHMSGDLPTVQKSFFRNIVAFISALVIIVKHQDGFQIKKGSMKFLILRSLFGTVGILCNFYAVDHLVLSDASMLNKMSPFFAILFSFLILSEKVTLSQGLIVSGAFIGSLFVIKPTFSNLDLLPAMIGLFGGMGAGMAYTLVRKLGMLRVKGSFVVFFFSGFSCLVTLPFMLACYQMMSGIQVFYLLLAGFAATGGQFAITAAYQYAPAKQISVYDYSQILFSAILGFLFFGQVPDRYSGIGYLIIITMAVLMFLREQKLEKQ